MAPKNKGNEISSPAEKALIGQVSKRALRQVNPDGSKPQVFGAGKGWQGGVIAATGPANPDQQVLTRDESLPPPTKSSVQNPTRLLQQYRLQQNRQAAAAQATTTTTPSPPPPPPANNAQQPPPRPAAPPSMSTPDPHRTLSKHAPPSALAPRMPPTTMGAPSAWAPPSAQPPPHPRPPVENGSAWKDFVGDQPADTVQPIRNWAQGRSDFAAKNKFKAPPVRSPGYGGISTTAHTAAPSSVQRPSLPSMPPSMTTTNGTPSSSSSWNVAGSKVASLAHRGGTAAAVRSPSMIAENGSAAGSGSKSTPRAKTAATSTSNETHLSKWATAPAPAAAAAPSPPPANATATTSEEAPPVAASPTTPAATAPPPPAAAAAPVVEEDKEAKAVPHLTINGIASGRRSSTATSSSSATSVAPPPARTTDEETAPAATTTATTTTKTAALPPPIPSTSTSASTLKTSQPSKTTAAFIASATSAAAATPPPAKSAPAPTELSSSFKLNGAAVDFEMPAKREYRAPDWVEKPQECANVEEMTPKLEKLSISTPVQRRVQRDESARGARSPRGSPMLPPADRARLASGGPQRVKKTPEEIEELMARMKLKNEETRKRVEAVEKDRARYESAQVEQHERASSLQRRVDEQQARAADEEQAKRDRTAALQKAINEERARTAAAKLRAKSGRAWDAGKVPSSSSLPGRATSPTPAPATSYPSVEAEAREARRRAEENREQKVSSTPAREITEEEAERIRRKDGVRGDDGGWETVVHHEGTGRAETVVR